jgi:hypothetical protein
VPVLDADGISKTVGSSDSSRSKSWRAAPNPN